MNTGVPKEPSKPSETSKSSKPSKPLKPSEISEPSKPSIFVCLIVYFQGTILKPAAGEIITWWSKVFT